jgi:DNA-binding MarR family transcriptional regulator
MHQELEILTRILSIKELLFNEVKSVFENEGLNSTELMIIYYIHHLLPECKTGDLAAALYMPMSTMTGIIDKMMEKGIVEREHSAEDRRVIFIRLRPDFIKKSEHYMEDLANIIKEITGELSPEWFSDFTAKLKTFNLLLEKRAKI